MALVVIGGHSRNIGKTSVVCRLISALPEYQWTAIKVTQFGHGICSANGEPCDCATDDHTIAISEERRSDTGTDSSRYLAAGAMRSIWVRTRQGQLADAMSRVRTEIARGNTVVESNSVLRFVRPDLYLAVLNPEIADFKPSAVRYLDRADALLVSSANVSALNWKNVAPSIVNATPRFTVAAPEYWSAEVEQFVRAKLHPGFACSPDPHAVQEASGDARREHFIPRN